MILRLKTISIAAFVFSLAATAANAAITHTTANLNLRGGPSTHYGVKTIIPAGAAIDVHSCGHTWCLIGWAGREGYVHSTTSSTMSRSS